MTTNASYELLSALLPTRPFALAYVLPLLFLSLLLTFSGTFVTLDRTRIFPPAESHKQARPKAKALWPIWSLFLQSGVGGLCSGFTFGVHFSTFLSLLIPSKTLSSPLGPKAFLSIWMLSAICCTIFSGRWKYVTLTFAAASGYATLAIALIVISHPSLITRIAITIAFTVIGTVLSLLPFASTRDIALRFANASTGSFGLVLSIAILVRNTAWGNVWERLWVSDGDGWGTSQEKGLSAAYSLLFCAGAACDWLLHVKLGENPDEKWDHYLAKYSGSMPTDGSRAGNFTPFASLYDRLLGRDRYFAPIAPDQKLPVLPLRSGPSEKLRDLQEPFDIPIPLTSTKPQPGFLRKKNIPRDGSMHTAKRAIRFQSGDDESSSSEEEDELLTNKPFVLRPLSPASSATLTNSYTDVKPPSLTFAEVPEYSDYEEDLTEASRERASRDVPHWTPGFFRRHSMRYGVRPADTPSQQIGSRGSASSPHLASQQERPLQAAESTPGAVVLSSIPATPSLIRAVDRIATAYTTQAAPPEGRDNTFARDARPIPRKPWDTFWADVKAKAQT